MRAFLLLVLAARLLPAQQSGQVAAALAAGSYFPLEVGDRWIYRTDFRFETAVYEAWRIDRTEDIDGKTYSVFTITGSSGVLGESRFRADAQGRIFILTGDGDQLFLDPSSTTAPGQLRTGRQGGPYRTAVGTFNDTLTYFTSAGLSSEDGQLGRGVGLLWSSENLNTGSSGGLVKSRALVEAVVGGGAIRFTANASLHIGMENLTLDVTGKQVTNCILPCYFVACTLSAPPPDPPGTYKPCAMARVGVENWPADASRSVRLRLLAPDSTVLYDQPFPLVGTLGEAVITTQVPLYSAPNQPFPPGAYQLTAATADGAAQASVQLRIK
jgi:hypothetical protein